MEHIKPIFEFTHEGKRFNIYEKGYVKIAPSDLAPDVNVIVNRIPARILEAAQTK